MNVESGRPQQEGVGRPWGPGMTLLFGFVLFLVYSIAQTLALVPMLVVQGGFGPAGGAGAGVGGGMRINGLLITGLNLSVATIVSCPLMLLMCGLLVAVRQNGPSMEDYLALRRVRKRALVGWTCLMLCSIFALSALNEALQRPPPEFVAASYATAGYLPLFWMAVGVLAPVAEEVFFRGFLLRGLVASRLRAPGAILLTSVVFMLVHAGQYDWFDLLQIGVVGVLLGLARVRSGSLLVPIAMHIALNLTSLTLFALQPA